MQIKQPGSIPTLIPPAVTFTLVRNLLKQKKFLNQAITPILSKAMQQNDGSLDETDIRKITHYYGLAVPAVLGEAFCVLRGSPMSISERWASTSQGAMTGLFDDFFDKQYLSDEAVEKLMQDEATSKPRQSNESLFNIFYRKALDTVADKKAMQSALGKVYEAQVNSKKQQETNCSLSFIHETTFFKGGASVLFYRTAFQPVPSDNETELLYKLGGIMQLANDIFDVYKDRENGTRTLVTEAEHIDDITNLLTSQLAECFKQSVTTGFLPKNSRQFLSILSLGIFSRAMVCLEQLKGLEASSDNRFQVHQYSRKQLICDMDTLHNMLRSAAYHKQVLKLH